MKLIKKMVTNEWYFKTDMEKDNICEMFNNVKKEILTRFGFGMEDLFITLGENIEEKHFILTMCFNANIGVDNMQEILGNVWDFLALLDTLEDFKRR